MSGEHVKADCPRCGYDLASELTRWREECPVEGRCWECGLGFRWGEVLREELRRDPRLVEHSPGGLALLVAAWRTLVLALTPGRYWGRVRLEQRVRPWRLVAWVVLTAGVAHGVAVVLEALAMGVQLGWSLATNTGQDVVPQVLDTVVGPIGGVTYWYGPAARFVPAWEYTRLGWSYLALVAGWAMFPIMMLVLVDTRARARVRWTHVMRATAGSLAWLTVFLLVHGATGAWRWWGIGIFVGGSSLELGEVIHAGLFVVLVGWLWRWWQQAVSRGWRLEKPREAWAWSCLASLLAMGIALSLNSELVMRVMWMMR